MYLAVPAAKTQSSILVSWFLSFMKLDAPIKSPCSDICIHFYAIVCLNKSTRISNGSAQGVLLHSEFLRSPKKLVIINTWKAHSLSACYSALQFHPKTLLHLCPFKAGLVSPISLYSRVRIFEQCLWISISQKSPLRYTEHWGSYSGNKHTISVIAVCGGIRLWEKYHEPSDLPFYLVRGGLSFGLVTTRMQVLIAWTDDF